MRTPVDSLIGNQLHASRATPYSVLYLGVLFLNRSCSWQSPAVPAHPADDPDPVFHRIFSAPLMLAAAMLKAEQTRQRRKSVLDYVQKDIARFSKKLGTVDRQRVDGHLTSIRDIESRLTPVVTSNECQFPVLGAKYDVTSSDNYEKV